MEWVEEGGQFLHSLRAYHSGSCHCEQYDLFSSLWDPLAIHAFLLHFKSLLFRLYLN